MTMMGRGETGKFWGSAFHVSAYAAFSLRVVYCMWVRCHRASFDRESHNETSVSSFLIDGLGRSSKAAPSTTNSSANPHM